MELGSSAYGHQRRVRPLGAPSRFVEIKTEASRLGDVRSHISSAHGHQHSRTPLGGNLAAGLECARLCGDRALYAENAHFQSHPFRPPEPARAYVERVFADEASADPHFAEPVVDGDRAAVEWRSRVLLKDGREENLIGVSLLRFDSDGLVSEQRDIWCQE